MFRQVTKETLKAFNFPTFSPIYTLLIILFKQHQRIGLYVTQLRVYS